MNKETIHQPSAEVTTSASTIKAKEVLARIALWGGLGAELVGVFIIFSLLPVTTVAAIAEGLFIGGSLVSGIGGISQTLLQESRKKKAIASLQSTR